MKSKNPQLRPYQQAEVDKFRSQMKVECMVLEHSPSLSLNHQMLGRGYRQGSVLEKTALQRDHLLATLKQTRQWIADEASSETKAAQLAIIDHAIEQTENSGECHPVRRDWSLLEPTGPTIADLISDGYLQPLPKKDGDQ